MRQPVPRTLPVSVAACATTLLLAAGGARGTEAPSFLNDVLPLFTRFGCNSGACHGKLAGQNGFRLSLRGYAPELDYDALTREFSGRRVNAVAPGESLLLRKPLGLAPHAGGKLFETGSRPHRILLAWLRAGAPGPRSDDPAVAGLDVSPASSSLRPGENVSLTARARYTDGTVRDVTWLCRFDSGDESVAAVDADGRVTVLRHGETSVRASFDGRVGVVLVTAPYERQVDPARLATRNNFVDDHVFAKLAALHVEPSDLSSDAEFLRRVYLDAVGVLPTPEEARQFLADDRPDKRARLVDALLERPEFVDHWALFLGDLLQNRREREHDVRGPKGVRAFHQWLREQLIANRPWDGLARDVLTAKGTTTASPPVGYFVVTVGEHTQPEHSEVVASVAQAFLGTRIGCARCHNHPLERYTQDDYYHFAAYFSRLRFDRHDPSLGVTTLRVNVAADGKPRTDPVGVIQPRTGRFLKPQPLDRSPADVRPDEDPRLQFAARVTDPKNELFSGAMVNRVWKHYLGVGLVEPVDDLRSSNPPSNPGLWAALNREFVGHRFDLRHLMRVILNSRTYQLSSATRPGNAADGRFYSHYYARRLPAEVLLDALCRATGVPEQFDGYPAGIRVGQMPDTGLKTYFLPLFGKSERVTACACERNGEVTMPQLLHLQNGQTVVYKIGDGRGRLNRLLRDKAVTDDAVTDELYLATLSRPAPDELKARVRRELAGNFRRGEEFRSREEVFRDLFWALLNSKEFAFNH
jgi:hypothetical protein